MSLFALQRLLAAAELLTLALALVLVVRPGLRRLGGPALVHASWLLLPLILLAGLLPHPRHAVVLGYALPALPMQGAASLVVVDGPSWRAPLWLSVWLLGMACTAAGLAWQQWRFQRSLGALQAAGTPRAWCAVNNRQTGPLLLGLLRPKIVLPADFTSRYTAQEQSLILAHERVHLRRGDLYANALACVLQTAFWFHPLLYPALRRYRLDQELACDAAVLRLHPQARKAYAGAILKTQLTSTSLPLGCPWQDQHPVKERIMQLSISTPPRWRRTCALLLLTGLGLASGYGAWAREEQGQNDAQSSPQDRYRVAFSFIKEVAQSKRSTVKIDIPVLAGRHTTLRSKQGLLVDCEIALDLAGLPDDMVELQLPFRCDGGKESTPKLRTHLGEPATVRVGSDAEPGLSYTFALTVTRWPDATPWPSGKPQAQ